VLGGSDACIAVYPGDWAVALVAFDAEIDVLGPNGERTIKVEELHLGPGTTPEVETVLAPNELVLRIRVPATVLGRASTYHKIRDRESYAFALASAAVAIHVDGDVVREARIALGGVATRPWRARDAESVLIGKPLTEDTARAAGMAAFATAVVGQYNAYKIELGTRTVADALLIAGQRAGAR
jgi:xanthine dehydrogenase YagS FAD-binding subunit